MSRRAATPIVGIRRNPFRRVMGTVATQRSVGVLLILLVLLGVGGLVLRWFVFQSWFLWFWAMTALTALELLVAATWDLIVDLRQGTWHLVTDQRAPWGPGMQWLLVPACLVAGILVDHYVTH